MKPRDDKYNVTKPQKPENRLDELDAEIRELVRRRDASGNAAEKQKLNAEITKLFAQYQRSKIYFRSFCSVY
jgi:hypothetical protein